MSDCQSSEVEQQIERTSFSLPSISFHLENKGKSSHSMLHYVWFGVCVCVCVCGSGCVCVCETE